MAQRYYAEQQKNAQLDLQRKVIEGQQRELELQKRLAQQQEINLQQQLQQQQAQQIYQQQAVPTQINITVQDDGTKRKSLSDKLFDDLKSQRAAQNQPGSSPFHPLYIKNGY